MAMDSREGMIGWVRRSVGLLALILVAARASGQTGSAAIAGTVRDASGAVLPGVTVEASSPALIEKTRSVVTDGAGQYRVVDLRPGVYTVTFTLAGFTTVKREGIELSGSFVAPVNPEMKVGAVEETVIVSGQSPIVDVQSTQHEQTLNHELFSSIPISRTFQSGAMLIPAVVSNTTLDVGGATAETTQPSLSIHGSKSGDTRILLDGMTVGIPGNGLTQYQPNAGAAEEVVYSTSGGLGEAETAGLMSNLIPRDGGNTFRGNLFSTYANLSMQSSNATDTLRAAGLTSTNGLIKVFDFQPNFGGPILKDKVWFFGSYRTNGIDSNVAGMYYNQNAGDVTKWTYVPDTTRQALDDRRFSAAAMRLTWQISPRNKLAVFWDEQDRAIWEKGGGSATQAPEASPESRNHPNQVNQASYASPVTNRLLIEAGFSDGRMHPVGVVRPGQNMDLIPVTEQAGIIPGLLYRGYGWSTTLSNVMVWRGSLSYVTGTHHAKFGYYGENFHEEFAPRTFQSLAYRFNNGVPNQLTESLDPRFYTVLGHGATLYAQDQWTLRRLTLQGGVRFQHFSNNWPAQQIGPVRFLTTPVLFPEGEGANVSGLTARSGAAYDLFGNGKTAIKVTLGQYLRGTGAAFSNMNPMNRITSSATRSWNDANKNFIPDCVFTNSAANGECGALSTTSFGSGALSSSYDPAVTSGFNTTPYEWDFSSGVQHQLLPRVSVGATYYRRWFGNFTVTQNRALAASDYTLFKLPVPVDSRLPNGGGGTLTYTDVNPNKFGQLDNYITASSNFGNQYEHWNGVDVDLSVRALNGWYLAGGTSTGRRFTDNCDIQRALPGVNSINVALITGSAVSGQNPLEFCSQTTNWLTNVKFLSSYTVPKIDVQLGATLQNYPGPLAIATWNAPNATVAPSLGRSLSGGAANVTVNLIQPGTQYGDRINELDLRIGKVLKFGRTRTMVGFDIFNALNSSAIQGYNYSYSPTGGFLAPTVILAPRIAKVSLNLEF